MYVIVFICCTGFMCNSNYLSEPNISNMNTQEMMYIVLLTVGSLGKTFVIRLSYSIYLFNVLSIL